VFGCRCFPNTTATAPNKLAPRSLPCVFLGYPDNTKGYRCYDPVTRRVLTSRHIVFDEQVFPFRQVVPTPPVNPTAPPPAPVDLFPVAPVARTWRHPGGAPASVVAAPPPATASPSSVGPASTPAVSPMEHDAPPPPRRRHCHCLRHHLPRLHRHRTCRQLHCCRRHLLGIPW
jgi:hypothetical protein